MKTSKRKENLENFYQTTTDKIIARLENGNVDSNGWSKGWMQHKGCYNFDTGTVYKGMNQFVLSMLDYEIPMYSTYNGWKKIDCKIKKGQHGHQIQVFSINKKEDKKTGLEKTTFYADVKYVFNAAQVDGEIPEYETFTNPESSIDDIEKFAENCNIHTIFKFSNRAYYSATVNAVTMPKYEQFKGNEEYYSTLFHEYGHATGHDKRLGRKFGGSFGDTEYAFEELVAELTSVFIMQHLGFYDTAIREDHLQYLASWLQALKNDNQFIIKASSKATKAADWLINQQIKQSKTISS